jgi:hypothetical protein
MSDHSTTAGEFGHHNDARRCGSWMNKKPWSIYEIGAVLGGFVVFWPLGLLALFLKMKKGELWKWSIRNAGTMGQLAKVQARFW